MLTFIGFLVVAYFIGGFIFAAKDYMDNKPWNWSTVLTWLPNLIQANRG